MAHKIGSECIGCGACMSECRRSQADGASE